MGVDVISWLSWLACLSITVLFSVLYDVVTKIRKRTAESTSVPSVDADSQEINAWQGYEYEVFLSFRGADTRKGFTDCLYHALVSAGVHTFRDNEELRVGEEIGPELLEGIRQSKISIPIFSQGYASSKWCLKEVAEMVKCKDSSGQMILPIFYSAAPNVVRNQKGSYERAFSQHKKKYDSEIIQQWRDALAKVGAMKGYELKNEANGHEGKLIKLVMERVLKELKKAQLLVTDNLVGIVYRVEAVLKMLEVGAPDVRLVGIWGMGGIGKTTLAKVIYNQILGDYEHVGFLKDIQETSKQFNGVEYLQSLLLASITRSKRQDIKSVDEGRVKLACRFHNKKVLILLDDVSEVYQLNALAGKLDWFGQGSRIIVTTRHRDVLRHHTREDWIYELRVLGSDQALQVFCKHALRKDAPTDGLAALSKEIVRETGGLPLALEIIGSFLYGKNKSIWEATSKKLQVVPVEKVTEQLRISYDALESKQKEIFLDIACLFVGEDKTIVSYMWEDYIGYPPVGEIEVLLLMSLIKIGDDNKFWMHDQMRELGKQIVREENVQPGKRTRFWDNDAVHVLETGQASIRIQAIHLQDAIDLESCHFTPEQFRNLPNLKFLQLQCANLAGDFRNLLPSLRWLGWQISSCNCMATNLNLKNLVVLDLSWSRVTHEWSSWKSIQMSAVKLKVLDLSYCTELRRTPDVSAFCNLERLSLRHCVRLEAIDPSIGKLKCLVFLDMEGCLKNEKLSKQLSNMESLHDLAPGAKTNDSFTKIPDSFGQLASLTDLILDDCGISKLPNSIRSLRKLQRLMLASTSIRELPESIGRLKSLVELVLSKTKVAILPGSIGSLNNLKVLKIDGSSVQSLPAGIGNLVNLELLDASECQLSGAIPANLGRLTCLKVLLLRGTHITTIPETIKDLPHLEILDASGCTLLKALPELPASLIKVHVTFQSMAPIPNLPELINLKNLAFIECVQLSVIPHEISKLSQLEKLFISKAGLLILPDGINGLPKLKELQIDEVNLHCIPKLPPSLCELHISSCPELTAIQGLRDASALTSLNVTFCENLEMLSPDLSNLQKMHAITVEGCKKLFQIQGIDSLHCLEYLDISQTSIIMLCDLANLKLLKSLKASGCTELQRLDGLDSLERIHTLNISGCKAIESLPNLSNLRSLRVLIADGCEKLQAIDGLEELEALTCLDIRGCKSIENLPNLSELRLLENFNVDGCEKLQELEGLEDLEKIHILSISQCKAITRLPNLSNLKMLQHLPANGCENLLGLDGLDELGALQGLYIDGCKSVEKLPNFSNLRFLKYLHVKGCEKLQGLEGLEHLEELEILDISHCTGIENLPDLSGLKKLQFLFVSGCKKLKEIQGLEKLQFLREVYIWGCESLQKLPALPRARIIDDPPPEDDGESDDSSDWELYEDLDDFYNENYDSTAESS